MAAYIDAICGPQAIRPNVAAGEKGKIAAKIAAMSSR